MLSPDVVLARRQLLKLSRDRVATEMAAYGHDWSEVTVMLVEVGEQELTEGESTALATVLGIADPDTTQGDGRVVTITIGADGTLTIDPGSLDDDQLVAALARALHATTA